MVVWVTGLESQAGKMGGCNGTISRPGSDERRWAVEETGRGLDLGVTGEVCGQGFVPRATVGHKLLRFLNKSWWYTFQTI